jgi:phenylpropionate dioxygenase-like ring-hydroxylating dioxygenase large terminal subunit
MINPKKDADVNLNVDAYISQDFFEKEKETIWKKSWLLAGRVKDLSETGSYFVFDLEVIGVSILVVKGSDNEIRAFHNICRHRGHKLCNSPCGRAAKFVCKFHGWVYDTSGKIFKVPWEEEFENLDKNDARLLSVKLDTWGGFVFVNLDPGPVEALSSYLRGFPEPLERYLSECNWVWELGHSFKCNNNWKLGLEGTHEAYHANATHAEVIFGRFNVDDQKITLFPDGGGVQSLLTLFQPEVLQRSSEPLRKAGISTKVESDNEEEASAIDSSGASFVEKLAIKYTTKPIGLFVDKALSDRNSKHVAGNYEGAINQQQAPNWMFDGYTLLPNVFLLFVRNKMTVFQYWPLTVDTCTFQLDSFYIDEVSNFGDLFARMHRGVLESDIVPQDIFIWESIQENFKAGYITDTYLASAEDAVRSFRSSIRSIVGEY